MTPSLGEKFAAHAQGVIAAFLAKDVDGEGARKTFLILAVSMIGIVALLLLAGVAFWQKNALLGAADLLVALLLCANLFLLYRTKKWRLACLLGFPVVALFFLFLFASGGVNNSAYVWIYTYPLFSYFLLGKRWGTAASLLLLPPIAFIFLLDAKLPFLTVYSLDLKLRFLPSYLVIVAFSYIYEYMREKTEEKLELYSGRLEEKVAERTADLQAAVDLMDLESTQRHHVEHLLSQSRRSLMTVLDSIEAVVYVADLTSQEVLFMNRRARDLFGSGEGKKCWQVFQRDQHGPCDFCANRTLMKSRERGARRFFWEMRNTLNGRWYDVRECTADWIDGRPVRIQIATDVSGRKRAEMDKNNVIKKLCDAMERIRKLEGIIPICSYCKNIRDNQGHWQQLEEYISEHSDASFTHSICEKCARKNFPDLFPSSDGKSVQPH